MSWARDILNISDREDLGFEISLEARRSKLGWQYELGNVAAVAYELNEVPTDDRLLGSVRAANSA